MMRLEAETEIEVVIGADHVMRLNIDGLCALRVGITTKGCVLRIRNDSPDVPVHHLPIHLSPLTSAELSRPKEEPK